MKLRYVLSFALTLFIGLLNAQDSVKFNLFRIGVGVGGFNYIGDIGTFKQLGSVDDVRPGYTFSYHV
jgi:hypothetical protein